MQFSRLGVASLGEAIEVYKYLPAFAANPKSELIVFSDAELRHPDAKAEYFRFCGRIVPVIGNFADLETMVHWKDGLMRLPLFIELNTGMNRLGLPCDALENTIIPKLERHGIKVVDHLLHHFATSFVPLQDHDRTVAQQKKFEEAKSLFRRSGVTVRETSAANSAAIMQGVGIDESHVRPGLKLYGPCGVDSRDWCGRQVGKFYTKVLNVVRHRKGDYIGYGFNDVKDDCVVALIAVGYADGFLRFYGGMKVTINGLVGTVHGFVSMDSAAVVFEPEANKKSIEDIADMVHVDDKVLLWGDDINEKAAALSTNAYQLMCAVSLRVPRIYVDDSEVSSAGATLR
jgi:alanine racemase